TVPHPVPLILPAGRPHAAALRGPLAEASPRGRGPWPTRPEPVEAACSWSPPCAKHTEYTAGRHRARARTVARNRGRLRLSLCGRRRAMTIMRRATSGVVLFLAIASVVQSAARQEAPVPDKLIVLTFDDSAKSHATYVAPRLKKLGFGGTFFITEGFDFPTNKTGYMTWDEIAGLHEMGFEIGNHTGKHAHAAQHTREAPP